MIMTIAVNCGCGFRVTTEANTISGIGASFSGRDRVQNPINAVLAEAAAHCSEKGHTMEISGTVQNG